jgi:spermidine synthase
MSPSPPAAFGRSAARPIDSYPAAFTLPAVPSPTAECPPEVAAGSNAAAARSAWRPYAILALAGANLTLVQFVAMKEFSALVGSNELVTLMVVAGYFLGLSGGYLVSDRLSRRGLLVLGALTLLLHASLPFSARWVAGAMAGINLAGNTPPFVFLLTLGGIAPFYAVFLPRLIEESTGGEPDPQGRQLARCYGVEIAGGFLGLVIVFLLTPARMGLILTLHLLGLVTLLLLFTGGRPRWLFGLLALPVAYLSWWPLLDRASLGYFYEQARDFTDPKVIASEFSPYQRVALHQHNLLVSLLPNVIAPRGPGHALVIAGGSLDNARYLAPRTKSLNVVEIDETVVRLTRKHLQEPRGNFPTNWELAIDDGKHFLGTWKGEPFDVISVDVPVPTHLQTAMLHSERFFALAASRLAPDGIFSISLAGLLQNQPRDGSPPQRLSNRVLAGLLRAFPHVSIVRVGDHDFAWASKSDLKLESAALQRQSDGFLARLPEGRAAFGSPKLEVLPAGLVQNLALNVAPIGEADMQIVLRLSWNKLYRRFYEPR